MSKKSKKSPGKKYQLENEKKPRALRNAREEADGAWEHTPVWQFSCVDFDHQKWGWKNFSAQALQKDIIEKLKNYESMTWYEIFQDKKYNHPVSTDDIDKSAKDRLEDLQIQDIDKIYRLRINGKQRIWGILDRYIFSRTLKSQFF